jgi:uncharacterized membrane protein
MTNMPWSGVSIGILATIVILGIYAIWKIQKELRSGFPLKDERTLRVSGKAAYFAFHIGSYFMIALMLGNILSREFRGVYLLDGWYALIFSIIVQSLMYLGFRFYFDRKEDFS